MASTSTGEKAQATQSFFVFVRDNNTGRIESLVIPGDVQVGLDGNPSALTLMGRLSVAATNYDVTFTNKGILQTSPDDTIIGVSLVTTPLSGRISLYLSQTPREGELHFVKDLTGTSDTVPIDIYPTTGYTIDGMAKVTLTDPTASLALVFLNGNWYRLVAGLGTSGGSGADPNAEYILLAGDGGLPNSRTFEVSTNLTETDTGAGGTITIDLSHILGAGAGTYTYATVTADAFGRITAISAGANPPPANASYLTALNEPTLTSHRQMSGGVGTTVTDTGAGGFFYYSVDPRIVPFLTGATFSGPVTFNGGLTGSLQQLPGGKGAYIVGIGGIGVTTGSNGQIIISGSSGGGTVTSIVGAGGTTVSSVGGTYTVSSSVYADQQASYALISSEPLVDLPNQRLLTASGGTALIDGGPGSTLTISSSVYADKFASYLVASASAEDPTARVLAAGTGVTLVDNGPGSTLVINASGSGGSSSSSIGANKYASYLLVNPDAEDVNARVVSPGTGISFSDGGPGGLFTINAVQGGVPVPAPAVAYMGHCTGSLNFGTHTAWTDLITTIPGNWFDDIQNGITRNGTTFTVGTTGYYYFHAFFNAIQGNQYIAYRLSGSNGTILQRTTWQNGGQPPSVMDGVVFLTSGSSARLQFYDSGGSTWGSTDPIGTAPDQENMRTGDVNMFLINPLTVGTVNVNVTGSFVPPDSFDYLWWPCTDTQGPYVLNYGTAGAIGNLTASSNTVRYNQVGGDLNTSIGVNTNGATGNYLGTLNTATQPTPNTSNITVSVWFRPNLEGGTGYSLNNNHQKILLKSYYNTTATWNSPFVAIDIGLAGTGNGQMEYSLSGLSPVGPGQNITGSCCTYGEWNHAGMTYDGTTGRCYLNGVLIFQFPQTGNIDYSQNGWWALGGNEAIPGTEYFQGEIADARVANTVRSPAWFAQVWASGRPGGFLVVSGSSGGSSGPDFDVFNVFNSSSAGTTSSIAIDGQGRSPAQIGTDVYFYASGTIGLPPGNPARQVDVFGGDTVHSGSVTALDGGGFTGSLTQTNTPGNPFIVGIGGTGVTTNSLGQVIISSSQGGGGGGTVNNTYIISGSAAQGQAAYFGYVTSSVWWQPMGVWEPFVNGLPDATVTDVLTQSILRQGSSFTFLNGGTYCFHANFNAYGSDAYISLRLNGVSSSKGIALERSTYRSTPADQNQVILDGIFTATSGDIWTLEYATQGTTFAWTGSNPLPGDGPMHTGEVSIFLVQPSAKAPIFSTPILAGVLSSNTSFSGSFQELGMCFFNPTIVNGFSFSTARYYFRAILDCVSVDTNLSAAVDLYDFSGIVRYPPGEIVGSILQTASPTSVQLQAELTSLFQSVTGSGLLEARLWRTVSGSLSSIASCRNARFDVEFT